MEQTTWSRKPRTDWADIRNAWIAGDSVEDICTQFGTTRNSVYSRSRSDDWPERVGQPVKPLAAMTKDRQEKLAHTQVRQAAKSVVLSEIRNLGQEVPAIIKEQIKEHFAATLHTTRQIHRKVDAKVDEADEVEDLRSLSSTLETIDRVARRTFGLDSPDGRNLGALVSCATSVSCPALGGSVIDVVPEPVTSP